jgi:hypothetical protein
VFCFAASRYTRLSLSAVGSICFPDCIRWSLSLDRQLQTLVPAMTDSSLQSYDVGLGRTWLVSRALTFDLLDGGLINFDLLTRSPMEKASAASTISLSR